MEECYFWYGQPAALLRVTLHGCFSRFSRNASWCIENACYMWYKCWNDLQFSKGDWSNFLSNKTIWYQF